MLLLIQQTVKEDGAAGFQPADSAEQRVNRAAGFQPADFLEQHPLHNFPDPIVVRVDRHTLYKRRWRARAENGDELAVNLEAPVEDGTLLDAGEGRIFRVEQTSEDVIAIPMPSSPEMAAKLGWYLGNQHLPVEVRAEEIVLEKVHTLAASLKRIGIPFREGHEVFRCKMHSHTH